MSQRVYVGTFDSVGRLVQIVLWLTAYEASCRAMH